MLKWRPDVLYREWIDVDWRGSRRVWNHVPSCWIFFFLSFVGTHFIRDSSLAGDGHAFGVLVKTHSTAILFCVCQIVNWNDEEARLIFLQARTFESPIPYVLSHNAKIVIVTFFFSSYNGCCYRLTTYMDFLCSTLISDLYRFLQCAVFFFSLIFSSSFFFTEWISKVLKIVRFQWCAHFFFLSIDLCCPLLCDVRC